MSTTTRKTRTPAQQQGLLDSAQHGQTMQQAAGSLLRYGLAGVLLWIGLFKFTHLEAHDIQGFISHSPFMAWMEPAFGTQRTSNIVGVSEIVIALLIAARFFSPLLCFAGSLGGLLTFLVTLSFMVSTPMTVVQTQGYWGPTPPGGFIIKDVFLLGASLWSAGEAWAAVQAHKSNRHRTEPVMEPNP